MRLANHLASSLVADLYGEDAPRSDSRVQDLSNGMVELAIGDSLPDSASNAKDMPDSVARDTSHALNSRLLKSKRKTARALFDSKLID